VLHQSEVLPVIETEKVRMTSSSKRIQGGSLLEAMSGSWFHREGQIEAKAGVVMAIFSNRTKSSSRSRECTVHRVQGLK